MRRVFLLRRMFAPAIAWLLLSGAVVPGQQQPPQAPASIRVRIAMVPVDVRIVDRQGNPVTDQLVPLDRRQFVTSGRVYQAGQYGRQIEDIKLTLKPPRPISGVRA